MKRNNENEEIDSRTSGEAFECKTCNRKFKSFQALGGHRASHKRPKLDDGKELKAHAKTHNCSICGQGFSLGQALGGHMRKHRDSTNEGFSSMNHVIVQVPVLKTSNTSSGTMGLDLNFTPSENDLKLLFGITTAPNV